MGNITTIDVVIPWVILILIGIGLFVSVYYSVCAIVYTWEYIFKKHSRQKSLIETQFNHIKTCPACGGPMPAETNFHKGCTFTIDANPDGVSLEHTTGA